MNHPFTCLIAGPTKAGKTTFVKKLIDNIGNIIDKPIHKILWFYTEDQPLYQTFKNNVQFIFGPPDINILKEADRSNQLVILDDLMQSKEANSDIISLFCRGCHHWNISLIHIVQNIFYEGLRTSRINSDYIVLFKNPADNLQVSILARQLFPGNKKYFLDSYRDATKTAHGYLMIDLTQYTPDDYRLKTDIFSETPTLYIPDKL
jgi:RNA helicase